MADEQPYRLRFPRGFNGYPYNTFKLEGYGVPRGYITVIGVAATIAAAGILATTARSNKRERHTQNKDWENATLEYAAKIQADPIYQLPTDQVVAK
eukprot:gene7198-8361_t